MKIADHTFLVTGGGSGLGAACVRRFVAGGGRAVIADVQKEAGEALAAELGPKVRFVETDVTNRASAERALRRPSRSWAGCTAWSIARASRWPSGSVGKEGPHRLESFSRVINVNLIGTFNMIAVAATAMSKSEPNASGRAGRDRQHGVGGGFRRANRAGGLRARRRGAWSE